MHDVRTIPLFALRSASPHPALTRRPPPRSAGRYTRRDHAQPYRSASCPQACTTLTGAALIIATFNGTTLNRTARDGTTIDELGLCRLSLAVPVCRELPGGSRLTPHAAPDTCPLGHIAVPHVVS